jgi:hypothetical protein
MTEKGIAIVAFILGSLGGALALAGNDLHIPPGVSAALVFLLTQVAAKLGYETPNSTAREHAAIVADLKNKEGQ